MYSSDAAGSDAAGACSSAILELDLWECVHCGSATTCLSPECVRCSSWCKPKHWPQRCPTSPRKNAKPGWKASSLGYGFSGSALDS